MWKHFRDFLPLIFAIPLFLFIQDARALDIEVGDYKGSPSVFLSGEYENGSSSDVLEVLKAYPKVETIVLLSSPGGSIEDYEIANYVFENGYNIVVAENSECVSYCTIIAVSDKNYKMEPGSSLLFHSVYIPPHYIVELIEEGYCKDTVVDEVVTESCGIPFTYEGIVVGLEEMNRETIRDMVVYLFKIGLSQELILNILDNGPTSFYQIKA